jgi:hypothetical protein
VKRNLLVVIYDLRCLPVDSRPSASNNEQDYTGSLNKQIMSKFSAISMPGTGKPEQIALAIEKDIRSGVLGYGDRLQSETQLNAFPLAAIPCGRASKNFPTADSSPPGWASAPS